MDVEEAKDRYVNTWTHCGKRLSASDSKMRCECGETWEWSGTLGSTMELLEEFETIRKVETHDKPRDVSVQPGFTF